MLKYMPAHFRALVGVKLTCPEIAHPNCWVGVVGVPALTKPFIYYPGKWGYFITIHSPSSQNVLMEY